MIWEQFKLTNAGISQRQIHVAETGNLNGRRLRFGIAKLGSGKPSSPSDIATMTDLVTPVTEGKIKKNYAEDVNHLMVAEVTNKEITTKEFISEIGIFSRLATEYEPPDADYSTYTLYGITYTESDPITLDPPSSINGFELFDVGIQNTLGNAAEVQLNYSTTTVFITHKDMDDHNLNPDAHPDKVTGDWHFFKSITELGLTTGTETLKQIVTTMPEKSTLYSIISDKNNMSQYPKADGGFLTVIKHTNNRIDLQFNNSPVTLANWTGMANYTAESDYWSGWAENIIDNSPHLRVRNYYIDPVSGSDDNDGLSETTPFKSFMPVLKKYQVLAITGDFNVFLKSGTTIVVDTVYFNAGLSFSGKFTLTTYGGSTETTILSTSTSSVVSVAFRNMGELELINVKFERSQTFTSSVIVGVYAVFTGNIDNCAYKYTQTNTVNSDGIYIHRCGNVSMRMINFQNCKRNAVQSDYGTELFLENASGSNNARGLVATKSTIRKGANINLGATTAEVKEGGGEIL